MENILDKINNSEDVKKLNLEQKKQLANEIRDYIIDVVSKNGGHLASNLGTVELTIALHSVFDLPKDEIVWDVGHQTYTHKILTGRKEKFTSLRKKDGIAGFPKTSESIYDTFNTGHSSTSISAALGIAKSKKIKNENSSVIAVIGDGALTGGIALEALNDAGNSNAKLIVILNDNEMSISRNVGGISTFLGKLRTKKLYTKSNNKLKQIVRKIPYVGEKIIQFVRKIKYSINHLFINNMFFEDIGFKYFGPINGHDIEKLEGILKIAKKVEGPVLIHIVTKKGKGYKPAEENPSKFHGISPFNIQTGETLSKFGKSYSSVFGKKIVELAKDKNIVAVTAAMKDGTGLTEFAKEYPDRFFDVGIAEQHAVCFAAGLATKGIIPVVPIYSSFYQRAYDQIIHDVCMQNLGVVMCSDRAGIVGPDGETHQGILDLSFTNIIPNLTVMSPKDFLELEQMLEFAVDLKSPVFIRYPRGKEEISYELKNPIELGKAEILETGEDLTIIAIGKMVARATKIADILKNENTSVEVINARFLKPIDEKTIIESIKKTKNVITIEDNIINGGLGSVVKNLIIDSSLNNIKIKAFGYPDEYIKHGSVDEIEKEYGLDINSIVSYIKEKNEQTRYSKIL